MISGAPHIPIMIVHSGYHEYLEFAIRQVKFTNPTSEIILLGDDANSMLASVCHYKGYHDYSEGVEDLKRNYVHLSSNGEEYEFFCLKRWFYIRNYMRAHEIEWVFAMDSDVLVFDSLSRYFTNILQMPELQAAYCIVDQQYEEYRWVASGAVSYVSASFLEKFCSFITWTYQNNLNLFEPKIDFHRRTGLLGGINDMTFFYLYYLRNQTSVLNLLFPVKGSVFSNGVQKNDEGLMIELSTSSERYPMVMKGYQPQIQFNNFGDTKLIALHFLGASKNIMHQYFTASRFKFKLAKTKRLYIKKVRFILQKLFSH